MATKQKIPTDFDYVFLNVGYTHRLTKDNFHEYATEELDTLEGVVLDGMEEIILVAVSYDEGDECEVYNEKAMEFLRKTKINPFGCIIIGSEAESKISILQALFVVDKIAKLGHCACLCAYGINNFDVYKYQGKVIGYFDMDSESG